MMSGQNALAAGKITVVDELIRDAREKVNGLRGLALRLENACDRLEPQPHPTSGLSEKQPDPLGFPGVRFQLNQLQGEIERIAIVCDRLEGFV